MSALPISIILSIVVLTVFLSLVVALRYGMQDSFRRTRFVMTAFFLFIVCTLTLSFWQITLLTVPYTVPALLAGILVGYVLGVRTEQEKLMMQGIEHYMEHFAHIHLMDFKSLTWWSFINFYSVMGGLLMINLIGLSNVLFSGNTLLAIGTTSVGAFLVGTIVPYLGHLWSISMRHQAMSATSER